MSIATEPRALTKKQQAIFDFIVEYTAERFYQPTYREIRDQFGLRSPNGIMAHLGLMRRKGWIGELHNSVRSIPLLNLPFMTFEKSVKSFRPLTDRQREVLDFIIDFTEKHFFQPSLQDVAGHFGFTATGVVSFLRALQRKGWITRSGSCFRSIEIHCRPTIRIVRETEVVAQ